MKRLLMGIAVLTLCVSAQARSKKNIRVKHRANCACEFVSIDGKLETRQRAYGLGSRAKARLKAQKNCQKMAPSEEHKARAVSCVFQRVKVNKRGNVISIKTVLEEEAVLAADIDALLQ